MRLLLILVVLLGLSSNVKAQELDSTSLRPVGQQVYGQSPSNTSHLQFGTNYYDGFGAFLGFQFGRVLANKHSLSAGIALTVKVLDTQGSPQLYALGDSTQKELVFLLSLPILYKYGLPGEVLFPYTIAGIVPSIGGVPEGYAGEDFPQFFHGFELDAVIGAGLSLQALELEARLSLPLVDPYVRPLSPANFAAHAMVTLTVGVPLYDPHSDS
jgi:hypothetical protein